MGTHIHNSPFLTIYACSSMVRCVIPLSPSFLQGLLGFLAVSPFIVIVFLIHNHGFWWLAGWHTCCFFAISRTREHDLLPILQSLHNKVANLASNWTSSSIIVDNTQGEINTIKYAIASPIIYSCYILELLVCISIAYQFLHQCGIGLRCIVHG